MRLTPGIMRAVVTGVVFAGALAGAGCGWVQWPPPGSKPRVANPRPPAPPARAPVSSQQAAPKPAAVPIHPASSGPPVPVGSRTVVVAKGDTVYAISRRQRAFVRAIIEANDLRPPYRLTVGQKLVVPAPRIHVVQQGETLYSLGRQFNVSLYALARANDVTAPYTIQAGQRLEVPRSMGKAPAAPVLPKARNPVHPKPDVAPKELSTAKADPPAPPRKPRRMVASIPKPPPKSGKGFLWPVKGKVVSGFGAKAKGLRNDGINIAAPRGTPVRAAENGVVAYAGNELRGFGKLLLIKHAGGWITAYAHNDELLVKRGDTVRKGKVISKVGSSGNVRSPQLHFELRRGRRAIDPLDYLRNQRA